MPVNHDSNDADETMNMVTEWKNHQENFKLQSLLFAGECDDRSIHNVIHICQ